MANPIKPKPKGKKSEDPLKGLKYALKAAQVAAMAKQVALLSGG